MIESHLKKKDISICACLIFVIRGDKPKQESFLAHPQSFSYASEMITFIKQNYDFTLGCAGYPEGHLEAQSLEQDIENLKHKVDNGAEYVVAQYLNSNAFFSTMSKNAEPQAFLCLSFRVSCRYIP